MTQAPILRFVTEAAQTLKIKEEVDPLKAADAALDVRVDDLEVLGGLTPGDINDTTNASLIRNHESDTFTELSAAIGESVSPLVPSAGGRAVGRAEAEVNIVVDGTSIDFGADSQMLDSTGRLNWPNIAFDGRDARAKLTNVSVSGQTIAQAWGDAATQVQPLAIPGKLNVLFVGAPTNDIFFEASDASIQTLVQNYALAARGWGFKVAVYTTLPRSPVSVPASFETKRQAYNAWLRANYTTFADHLCDIGNDATIGQVGQSDNAYYFADKTHPTTHGYRIIAGYARAAVAALGGVVQSQRVDVQQPLTSMWVPAEMFRAVTGPATAVDVSTSTNAWLLDPDVAQSVQASVAFPPDWKSWSAEIHWANGSAVQSGGVRLNLFHLPMQPGKAYDTAYSSASVTGTAAASRGLVATEMRPVAASVWLDHPWYSIKVSRSATDPADTLAFAARFFGVEFIRRS